MRSSPRSLPPSNMPEEDRSLLRDEPAQTPSSCSCCCVLKWTLCGLLLLVGAAVALEVCLPQKPKELGQTNAEVDELAQVVLQLVQDQKLKAEARQVEGDAEWGKDLQADAGKIMDLLRAMEGQLSPEVAARIGVEITSDDIARIMGVTGTHGHQFNLEDAKKGAFQGDMVPADSDQLKKFVDTAEAQTRKARGSFGTGTPWTKGIVNFCFHHSATDRVKEAVQSAIQQYKKAVPCIQWNDVGLMSDEECQESPAVLITSSEKGCWSYVGMLKNRKSQQLNLQSPGCDSVGTAIHEMGHALGMSHEQARPDRDEYVEIHASRIREGKKHNFDINPRGDTERPYDLLSIMHYDADSFSTDGKPTITAKDKAYELYTDNASLYHLYKMGNRVGLTQLDADQVADLYRAENGLCLSHLLGEYGEHSCIDLQKGGAPWKDKYNRNCDDYVRMQEKGRIKSCAEWASKKYCCDCNGGLRLQTWAVECDLCRPVSLGGCDCKEGPWTLFGEKSSTACGNPGYVNHFPMCVVDESCKDKFSLGGLHLARCATYTSFTTKGCRCKRHRNGWTFKRDGKEVRVPNTCGNPNEHAHGPWCYVEENEQECQGDTWGTCEESEVHSAPIEV
ncbi:unnamed protein product [Effrenium voratum]|nr:unnamed protein product [Effrenium voratum]